MSIRLTTNRTERVNPGTVLHVGDTPYTISSSRPNNDDFLVKFEGVLDRNAADQLRGEELRAEPLDDPDELWVHELIGASVVDQTGQERGTVTEVLANPASDLLALDTGALVPVRFIESIEDDVISVDVPDGLFALYEEGEEE